LEFAISSAYPNPASNAATFSLTLSRRLDVTVHVYNASGQKVKTLVDGTLEPGSHRIAATTDGLQAGTYFCTASSAGRSTTRKFLIVR